MMLHHYLLAKGREAPDSTALVCRDQVWSYATLERRAAGYAAQLRALGLGPGKRMAFVLDPCPEAIALVIACSMLGAVFVPLSPEMPPQRIDLVLRSVTPAAVVRQGAGGQLGVTHRLGGQADGEQALLPTELAPAELLPPPGQDPAQMAYVIFTSGTTGQPKGIMASHRAAIGFFRGFSQYGVTAADRIGTVAPLQFDFSLCDMGVTLGCGATLVQVPRLLVHKQDAFIDYLARKQVTIMHAVPSVWSGLLAGQPEQLGRLTDLRAVMYAGESFAPHQLRTLEQHLPGVQIVQGFGHSESIGCSFKRLPRPFATVDGKVSSGQAIAGMEMFLLDEQLREITAPHVVGELYLKGEPLFSGYWQDPQLTAATLVPDPRPGADGAPRGGTVFKSGDRMFRDEAGDFYACGRVDLMVKISGYRVELEEIENRLAGHPGVADAVVVPLQEDDRLRLVAYVVAAAADGQAAVTSAALREHCADALPRYMRPSEYHFVAALPTTVNGKRDRHQLAESMPV